MKRYLASMMAVTLAITFAAFSPPVKRATYFFMFLGTVTDAAQVGSESPSYWVHFVGSVEDHCDSVNNKACVVEVAEGNTLANPRRIDPAKVNLIAIAGAAGSSVGYTPAASSIGIISRTNKQ